MDNNVFYILVLDSVRVPDAVKFCAQHEAEFALLYHATEWEPQQAFSPVCITCTAGDPVYQQWQTDPQWASSGVLFEYDSQQTHAAAIEHLSRNITVLTEDERLLLLRFYSPHTLAVIANYPDSTPADYLLGNAVCAHFSPLLWDTLNIESTTRKSSDLFIKAYRFPTLLAEELLA